MVLPSTKYIARAIKHIFRGLTKNNYYKRESNSFKDKVERNLMKRLKLSRVLNKRSYREEDY